MLEDLSKYLVMNPLEIILRTTTSSVMTMRGISKDSMSVLLVAGLTWLGFGYVAKTSFGGYLDANM